MFGFIVFVVAVIWTLAAHKSVGRVLAWGAGLSVAAGLLAAAGLLPMLGAAVSAGLGAAVGSVIGVLKTFRHPAPPRSRVPGNFGATHAHDNIALNARDQLWVRTQDGREVVLSRFEVREVAHLWHPDRGYKGRNRIELRTIRLDMPLVVAPFNRHPETIFGAPKNAAEAEEWHARLSAFLQRT